MSKLIGVIGAMEEEITLLKQAMANVSIRHFGGVEFCQGFLNGKPIVLCKTGVGKVNSAYSASVLILCFKITALIFTGVAGAAHPHLRLGDIVAATDCLYHDMDATAMGWKISEIPDGSLSLFPCDQHLNALISQAALNAGLPTIYQGRIVTGDQFIADTARVQDLHSRFKAWAIDMESAAVAHIAVKNHVPCAVIRSISDKADDGASFDYSSFMHKAAQNSAALVAASVRLL